MKKLAVLMILFASTMGTALAHPHHGGYYRHYHGSSCSSCVYLLRSDYREDESRFANCDNHYLLTKTTVNYYSNGTKRTYYTHTIFNNDGTVLIDDCYSVKHTIYEDKHYFLVRKGKFYQIMASDGKIIASREYKSMQELEPNKILVKSNKLYGIIDLGENIIVPIKYKSFESIGHNLFLTDLNGYYGIIDSSNNIVLKNKYDKIKPLFDTYLLKYDGKKGLCDKFGNLILEADNDSIKKFGEYILVKKDKLYSIYDTNGKRISDKYYKKVDLERNTLKVLPIDGDWQELNETI